MIQRIAVNLSVGSGLRFWGCLVLCLALGVAPQGIRAEAPPKTVITVASAEALAAALAEAGPGSVLQLAAGDYGDLVLKDIKGEAAAPITLRSADPAGPARFSTMDLRGVSHFLLQDLSFDYHFSLEDKPNLRPFQMSGGQDITIRNSLFDGDVATGVSPEDDGFPTGFGLSLRNMVGVVLQANEIRGFYRGLVISQSADIEVRDNDMHAIRMDGMNFAQVQNVRIENNNIHDFHRILESADHSDMIQFWTAGTTKPSTDITIRGNILNSGTGWYTQSIFMRNDLVDRGKAGPEMFYRNITIENNVIVNAHLHGISVGETVGLRIDNNTLIHNAASQGKEDNPVLWTPQIRVAPSSSDVIIQKNVTSKIFGYDSQASWAVSDNVLIQDRFPGSPGFYDQMFVAARSGDPTNLANFSYLAGGPLDRAGIGAPQLDSAANGLLPETVARPVIRVIANDIYSNRFTFDASSSTLPKTVTADEVNFSWSIDQGAALPGPQIEYDFTETGPHEVALTLALPDGTTASSKTEIAVRGPEVLAFSSESGSFISYAKRDPVLVPDLSLGTGPAVLGQGVAPILIPPGMMEPFFGASDFELRLRLRGAGSYKAAGELLRIHQTLVLNVTERGALEVRFDTATSDELKIVTGPIRIFSTDWHDVVLKYSSMAKTFIIMVDGHSIGSGRTSGLIRPLEHWGLALGSPFATIKAFDGELESMSLLVNQEEFSAKN